MNVFELYSVLEHTHTHESIGKLSVSQLSIIKTVDEMNVRRF